MQSDAQGRFGSNILLAFFADPEPTIMDEAQSTLTLRNSFDWR